MEVIRLLAIAAAAGAVTLAGSPESMALPAGRDRAALPELAAGGPYLELRGPEHLALGRGARAELTVELAGAHPRDIELHADVGAISRLRQRRDGRLVATYTPPAGRFARIAVISAAAHGGSDFDWIAIRLDDAPPRAPLSAAGVASLAAADQVAPVPEASIRFAGPADLTLRPLPGRVTAGFRLGYVTNRHKLSSPAAIADVSIRLPLGAERFELGAEIGIWSRKLGQSTGAEMTTTSLRAMPLRARLIYELPLAGLALFGGAGAGVIVATTTLSSEGSASSSRLNAVPAAGVMFGARVPVGPGRISLEAGWWHASLGRPELASSIAGLEVSAGYQLRF